MLRLCSCVMMIWICLGMGAPVDARTAQNPTWTPRQSEREVYLTESKLKTFHKVHKKVTKRTKKYHKKIKKAKSEKAKVKLAAKAKRDIVKIIEKSPLTMSEYNQILRMLLGKS